MEAGVTCASGIKKAGITPRSASPVLETLVIYSETLSSLLDH